MGPLNIRAPSHGLELSVVHRIPLVVDVAIFDKLNHLILFARLPDAQLPHKSLRELLDRDFELGANVVDLVRGSLRIGLD